MNKQEEAFLREGILRDAASRSKVELDTARIHMRAAQETLKHVSSQISMRTVAIAQIAATLMTNAHPKAVVLTMAQATLQARAMLQCAELQEEMDYGNVKAGIEKMKTDLATVHADITHHQQTPDPGR